MTVLEDRACSAHNFYVYWYKMRSGRCNDGSATPGCAGDQGTTYSYGNNFSPAGQTPFPRDIWLCVEIHAKANTVGASDGELALWVNDVLVGEVAEHSEAGEGLPRLMPEGSGPSDRRRDRTPQNSDSALGPSSAQRRLNQGKHTAPISARSLL
jgi:hypothetical protein